MTSRTAMASLTLGFVLLTACGGGDDGALDLEPEDETTAPDGTAPTTSAVPSEPEEPDPTGAAEELHPPLPALEPDPSSDVPVEDQRTYLELHAQVYAETQRVLQDPHLGPDGLERVLAGPALEDMVATVARFRDDGLESRMPDTEIAWVRVAEASGGPAVVHECRRYGPNSGLYDARTGDLVEPEEERDFVLEVRYDQLLVDESSGTYAVEVRGFEPDQGCDA